LIEDLNLLNSLHFSKLHYDDFEDKLSDLLGSDDLNTIEMIRNKLNKRKISAEDLLVSFMNTMKKVSLRNGYEIFPHFIRTIQN